MLLATRLWSLRPLPAKPAGVLCPAAGSPHPCPSPSRRGVHRAPPLPEADLCEIKSQRRFASLALGPGSPSTPLRSVPGVRERAVERLAQLSPLLFRAHAAKAECDPGPSARLRREAAPNSFRRDLLSGEGFHDQTVGMT